LFIQKINKNREIDSNTPRILVCYNSLLFHLYIYTTTLCKSQYTFSHKDFIFSSRFYNMGSCCSKSKEKTSDREYINNIKNDFVPKLQELPKRDEVQGALKIKKTKNDGAQVSKARGVKYNDSFRAPKNNNMFIMTSVVAPAAGNQGGGESYHGDHHGGGGHGGGGGGGYGGHYGGHHDGGGGGGCGVGGGGYGGGGGCGGS